MKKITIKSKNGIFLGKITLFYGRTGCIVIAALAVRFYNKGIK